MFSSLIDFFSYMDLRTTYQILSILIFFSVLFFAKYFFKLLSVKQNLVDLKLNFHDMSDFKKLLKSYTIEIFNFDDFKVFVNNHYNFWTADHTLAKQVSPDYYLDKKLLTMQEEYFNSNLNSKKIFIGRTTSSNPKIAFSSTTGNKITMQHTMENEAKLVVDKLFALANIDIPKKINAYGFYEYILNYDFVLNCDTDSSSSPINVRMLPSDRSFLKNPYGKTRVHLFGGVEPNRNLCICFYLFYWLIIVLFNDITLCLNSSIFWIINVFLLSHILYKSWKASQYKKILRKLFSVIFQTSKI